MSTESFNPIALVLVSLPIMLFASGAATPVLLGWTSGRELFGSLARIVLSGVAALLGWFVAMGQGGLNFLRSIPCVSQRGDLGAPLFPLEEDSFNGVFCRNERGRIPTIEPQRVFHWANTPASSST